MNDQQLETVLRRSLARHADTIGSGPSWPPVDDVLAGSRDRRRRPVGWWAVAAAVAAVLAVVGIVVAIRHATSEHSRPATPHTVTRTACAIDLPQSWLDAVDAGTLKVLDTGQIVIGGAADGAVVVRDPGSTMSRTVLIAPDGSTRTVDERPVRESAVGSAVIDRTWIVLPVVEIKDQVLTEFDVIDRATLHVTERVPLSRGNKINSLALLNGHLYWMDAGRISDHDIATRQSRIVTPSGATKLLSSPTGVAWSDAQGSTHLVAGSPPDQVPGRPGRHPGLVTDGATYAWLSDTGIAWYSPATKQTVVVQGFPGSGIKIDVRAVAGPYVIVEAGNGGLSSWVVDTRTGTVASSAQISPLASGGGILAYGGTRAVVLHVDRLPELHC